MNRKTFVETAVVASFLSAAGVSGAGPVSYETNADAELARATPEECVPRVGGSVGHWHTADIEDHVNRLIVRYGRRRGAPPVSTGQLADLGVDVLALVDIVNHVESRFGVQLDPHEILAWLTPADIVQTVERVLRA